MALGVWATKAGAGTHQWDVTAATEIRLARIANYIEIMYNPSVLLAKLSVALQILNIFAPDRRGPAYWICQVTIWVNILFFTAMMLCAVFQCWPREKIWDKTVVGTCGGTSAGLLASSSVSFVIDLTLLLLPIVCVWKLQMSAHRKWAISAVFAIGSFACVCSLMRVVSTVSLVRDKDLTFRLEELGLWSSGEIASGIIAGCMPIVPQLVRHVGPKIASTVNVTSRMRKSSSNGVRKAGPSPRSSRLSLKGLRGSADAFVELESQGQRFQRDWPSSEYGKDAMEKVHSYGN